MYERMLNKAVEPSLTELIDYCGACRELIFELNDYLQNTYGTEISIKFPFGNKYGWGIKHALGKAHICYIFAEKDALCVMLRLTNAQFLSVRDSLLPYTQEFIDHRYPCSDGGYIHYRVLDCSHLADIKTLLDLKLQKLQKKEKK